VAGRRWRGVNLGLGAHTDYECFTLLPSSAGPGLEILFPFGPLTVNVADSLMR
jgi:hypothetical protein